MFPGDLGVLPVDNVDALMNMIRTGKRATIVNEILFMRTSGVITDRLISWIDG
jgi:hypothetical protein